VYPFSHETRENRLKQQNQVVTAASTCSRVAILCCSAWTRTITKNGPDGVPSVEIE
jgi:hypothetical protein